MWIIRVHVSTKSQEKEFLNLELFYVGIEQNFIENDMISGSKKSMFPPLPPVFDEIPKEYEEKCPRI